MASVVPDPKKIRSFRTQAAFEAWLQKNHARETEMWLKIHKKGSGKASVTSAQALDVALCWGWIDGIRKGFDERSFLQRYTPRRTKSIWSQINRDHVERLTAAGRMQPHGQQQIDAAKADGRWDAAYAPIVARQRRSPRICARRSTRVLGRTGPSHARPPEPVRARLSHEQHEDACWAGEEDRGAGRDAGARGDDCSGAGMR